MSAPVVLPISQRMASSSPPSPSIAAPRERPACADDLIGLLRPAPPARPALPSPGAPSDPAAPVPPRIDGHGVSPAVRDYERKISLVWNGAAQHHRSGWAYALESLLPLHCAQGVVFDGFIEKTFAWEQHRSAEGASAQPYTVPWVGVAHNPPGVPDWFNANRQSPQSILGSKLWVDSLDSCRGLFTLSRYLRDWLEPRVPVQVEHLLHPTGAPGVTFDPSRYRKNPDRKLVQVGWWLRRFHSLYTIPTTRMRKVLLRIGAPWSDNAWRAELAFVPDALRVGVVEQMPYLDNRQYDALLSENVVFLDLYDSSANNALIECIVRGCPVLVNRLDAVVEYLGDDYPLYFDTLNEAATLVEDEDRVLAAHRCLLEHPVRERLTRDHFLRSLIESRIYKAL